MNPPITLDPAVLPLVPDPSKTFDYWATSDSSPWIAYDFTKQVTGNIDLYAKYNSTVIFNVNGGTLDDAGTGTPSEDRKTVTFSVKQNVTINPLPTVIGANHDEFTGWFVADEDWAPTSVEFKNTDKVTSDLNVVAVYNNTKWQVVNVYNKATPDGYTIAADKQSIVFAGTADKPIELVKLSNEKIGSDTLNGYFIGYQFEAPEEITASNINLYRIQMHGNWIPLADVVEPELSTSGHFVVNVFEPIEIDAIKEWVAATTKEQTYKYNFAKASATGTILDTLTVTFDPQYVQFGGMVVDPEDPDGDPVFEVNEFSIYNYAYTFDVTFSYVDETGAVAPTKIEVTSGQTVNERVAELQKTDPTYKNPLATPVYTNKLWEFQYWTVATPTNEQKQYHDETDTDPVEFTGNEPIWGTTAVNAFNHQLAKVELVVEPVIEDGDIVSKPFNIADAYDDAIPQVLTLWYGSPRDAVQAALEEKGYVNKNSELEGFYVVGTDRIGFGGRTFDCWAYVSLVSGEIVYVDFTDNGTFHKDWTLKDGSAGFIDAQDTLVLTAKFNDRVVNFNSEDDFVGPNKTTVDSPVTIPVGVGKSLNYWDSVEGNDLPVPVVEEGFTYYWTSVAPKDGKWDTAPVAFDMDTAMVKGAALNLYAYAYEQTEATVAFIDYDGELLKDAVLETGVGIEEVLAAGPKSVPDNFAYWADLDGVDVAEEYPETWKLTSDFILVATYEDVPVTFHYVGADYEKGTVVEVPFNTAIEGVEHLPVVEGQVMYSTKDPAKGELAEFDPELLITESFELWQVVNVDVTFITEGMGGEGTVKQVYYGTAIPAAVFAEVEEGLNVTGWSTVPYGTQDFPVVFDKSTKITEAIPLYAIFAEEEVKFETTLNMADFTGIYVYIGIPKDADPAEYTVETSGSSYRKSYAKDPVALDTLPKGTGARENMYRFEAVRAGSPEMTDKVTVTVKKGNEVVKTETYSVYSVAQEFLKGELTQDQIYLVTGLLQYGYYGHIIFKNPLEFNPEIDEAPALASIPSEYAAQGDPTNFGTYVTNFRDALDLDAAIAMNLYYTLADGYKMDDFTYSVKDKNGNEYTKCSISAASGNRVLVRIEGIKSPQMDDEFTVTMTLKSDTTKTATWTRSVMICAYQGCARTSGDGVSFLQALYQYYKYANIQWKDV